MKSDRLDEGIGRDFRKEAPKGNRELSGKRTDSGQTLESAMHQRSNSVRKNLSGKETEGRIFYPSFFL